MNKGEFVNRVQEMTGLPDKDMAAEATRIVLSILSHRLTPDESQDVAAQLPRDLQSFWNSDTWIINFLTLSRQYQLKYRRKEEMFSLIDNELQKACIPIGAEQLAICVFHVLKEQIAEGEARDIADQLPEDIEQFWLAA